MYMMVNSKVLGGIHKDEQLCQKQLDAGHHYPTSCMTQDEHLASFGMGSSMMGILLLASGMCFVFGLGNVVPQAYGSGNFRLVGAY